MHEGTGGLGGENEKASLFCLSNPGQEMRPAIWGVGGAQAWLQLRTVCGLLLSARQSHANEMVLLDQRRSQ